jgi:hypothetical protein
MLVPAAMRVSTRAWPATCSSPDARLSIMCARGSHVRQGGPCCTGLVGGKRGEFQSSLMRLMPDRVARQINGPDDSARSSIPRHWRMNTSSCCQVLRASLPVNATILAPCSLTAETSARWSWIRLSRVIMSQPCPATPGIHTRSGVAGSEMRHAGRARRWMVAPGSPGYVASLRSPATTFAKPSTSASK